MTRAFAAFTALLFTAQLAAAGDAIWSALVLATNEPKPGSPSAELERFTPRLKNIFGYKHYELIGSHTEALEESRGERWLIPSKIFSLRVSQEKSGKDTHLLDIELYQKDRTLVTTRARLGRDSPLFVRGPSFGTGQLLIVLSVK